MDAVAQEHLLKMKVAELACANRQERNRQALQKGGMLHTDRACTIARKRVVNRIL